MLTSDSFDAYYWLKVVTNISHRCFRKLLFLVTIVFSNYHYLLCELLQQCAQPASCIKRTMEKGFTPRARWRVLLLLFRVESLHRKDIAQDATLSRSALAAVDRRARSSQCNAGGFIKGK